ncbi:hypothetical protein RYX56_22815, partial [Alkalihalophilus lindianensis]
MPDSLSDPVQPVVATRRAQTIQTVVWLSFLAFVTWAFVGLTKAFLLPVIWAVTLAVIFHPIYRRIRDRMEGKEGTAATLTTVLIFFVVL